MQQLFRLLIFLISPTYFGQQIRPSSGALFDCIYSFWYNAPTLLLTGATVAAVSVHYNKRCIYSQKVFLRMGEFVTQNV